MLSNFTNVKPIFQEIYPLVKSDFNELRWASFFFNLAYNKEAQLIIYGSCAEPLALCFCLALQAVNSKHTLWCIDYPEEKKGILLKKLSQYNCDDTIQFFPATAKQSTKHAYIFIDVRDYNDLDSLVKKVNSVAKKSATVIADGVDTYETYLRINESFMSTYTIWHENIFIGKIN